MKCFSIRRLIDDRLVSVRSIPHWLSWAGLRVRWSEFKEFAFKIRDLRREEAAQNQQFQVKKSPKAKPPGGVTREDGAGEARPLAQSGGGQ